MLLLWLLQPAPAGAEMTFSGVLANSGEANETLVDFVGIRTLPWYYTSGGMDGVFVDADGSLWSAGPAGMGKEQLGYLYKYSPSGKVLARYVIGPKLFLASKLAADDRCLCFLAGTYFSNHLEKTPYRLDRTVPPPGLGAVAIPVKGLHLGGPQDQMAGHLYKGRLLLSVNPADANDGPVRIVSVEPAAGNAEPVLSFAATTDGVTSSVSIADVDPLSGAIYLNRQRVSTSPLNSKTGEGGTLCEAYDPNGRRTAAFMAQTAVDNLLLSSWTPAAIFTTQLLPDSRFQAPSDELAGFAASTRQWAMGYSVNQVAVDNDNRVYAASSDTRSVMVFAPDGTPIRRIGALAVRYLAPGPRGELWLLCAEGGLALDLPNTRSSERTCALADPAGARPDAPPKNIGTSYADVSDLRSLIVLPQQELYYRLCNRKDQSGPTSWEIRMGTASGPKATWMAAVGKLPKDLLQEPGNMCLLTPAKGPKFFLVPDAIKAQVFRVPYFTSNADLAPAALDLSHPDGKPVTLDHPRAVTIDPQSGLLLADDKAVYRFKTPDPAAADKYVLDWQSDGIKPDDHTRLADVIADGSDIFVVDQGGCRVMRLDDKGHFVEQYGLTNEPGNAPDRLNSPRSAVLIGQFLYVADTGNLRVLRLKVR